MERSDLVGNCCEELRKKMALGKRCGSTLKRANEGLGLGLGFVRYTLSMSGKRIAISSNTEVDNTTTNKDKKNCNEKMILSPEKSMLESLPQDILIKILCGVDHDDLKQLFLVSKIVREATLIAKQWHFAYSTPTKISVFRNSIDLEDAGGFEEVESSNAPKKIRSYQSRLSGKNLADISVALFASPDEEQWPRKEFFMEMETEN